LYGQKNSAQWSLCTLDGRRSGSLPARGTTLNRRKEVKQMLRAGRIIFNPADVASVLSDGRAGATIVTLKSGKVHTFEKYADAVWSYFKRSATNLTA
jgi:hypothetical protein